MNKIEVFLRQCYHSRNSELPNRHRPEWFDKKKCFENLKHTLNTDLCNLNIVYDNCYGEPANWLSVHDKTYLIKCGSEANSFLRTLEFVAQSGFSEDTIVYFLEDDYLHRYGWAGAITDGFASTPGNYVTLYDHADKYLPNYRGLKSEVFVGQSCHWRTTPSTCQSFAVRWGWLKEDMGIHVKYSAETANGITRDWEKFEALGAKGRVLVSPMPGFATHVDQYMSPLIDWKQYANTEHPNP